MTSVSGVAHSSVTLAFRENVDWIFNSLEFLHVGTVGIFGCAYDTVNDTL